MRSPQSSKVKLMNSGLQPNCAEDEIKRNIRLMEHLNSSEIAATLILLWCDNGERRCRSSV